ncbi:MAG: hypothetical protein EON91_13980 [Brevundimonas sp.]|jgi:hypothetical protein|uniref:hypothetical protein n=1 Tax=Brevundimonas sp. TaxID=1871086 RepID=UPI0010DAECCC|nr:hypothetical protein [Brevundimonas sp.]RYD93509.1 MAG: hypothetical protein EOP61_23465 [Sphingomonadales bacterium]RZJ16238.1 MAG: hypothetical protein EON91_13980 [Brevundimonas sp.]
MQSDVKSCVEGILGDDKLDRDTKVRKLRQVETDVLARQRAATEGMTGAPARDGEDLKVVERALMSLGETAVDQGPASL